MGKKILVAIFLLGLTTTPMSNLFAWNDRYTHKDLSKITAQKSQLTNDYIKSIGYEAGLTLEPDTGAKEQGATIPHWIELIKKGAFDEDSYTAGSLANQTSSFYNHFHNPLTNTGLDDYVFVINHVTGQSSRDWAQDNSNEWAWQKVREYYRLALTSQQYTDRNANFEKIFKGLGHIIHLIQDAAQPAHTRNDAHPLDDNGIDASLEYWAQEDTIRDENDPLKRTNRQKVNDFAANPVFPAVNLNVPTSVVVPIYLLWDTNQYNGLNPSTLTTYGLAEYSNANFASDDTIFTENFDHTDRHYFPYPQQSSVEEYEQDITGNGDYRTYFRKGRDGETIEHFAVAGRLYRYLSWWPDIQRNFINLDDNCHEDYAQKLIPRAVGYSAGLLNYFFRGELEVVPAQGGVKIKNINQEAMDSYIDPITGQRIGSINIYYDDLNNTRHLLATYELSAPLALGQETPVISFVEPNDNIRPSKFIIVFYGQLGEEKGAVIGKVISPPINIYYVSKRGGIYKIYKMDTDGNNQTIVYDNTNISIQIGKLAPSPDGNTLAFTVSGPQIYLLGLTDGSLRKLADGEWPNWSPDGKKIVFQRETGQYLPSYGDVELFIKDIETGIETQLTNIPASSYSGQPAWSPDGNSIAYMKFDPYDTECLSSTYYIIYRIDPSGNAIGPVTCHTVGEPYLDSAPTWSPNGQGIGFTRRRYGGSYKEALYKVDMATQTAIKLTDSTGEVYSEFTPDWSHDGKSITIGSNRDGDFDIWLVDPNGGGYIKNLTNSNPDIDGYPAFGE